jgi:steroid 5-alpha reductase family enzyme
VIESPWIALAIGASIAAACMTALWLIQVRTHDATLVDIGWAYFFEWLLWVGWAVIATAAPWGWMTPALLLLLLFTITGIRPTEEQALRSRGEDYRRYQRETSVFVPSFPKRA